METFLLTDPYLKFEQSVLTRVLYKLSASLRRNKHYQYLKMVEKSLCKLARLELVRAVSHVSSCCPSSKDGSAGGAAALMPSRQLVEFLLVKLLGAAELTKRTISLCAEAFMALLKSFQEKLQEWYSFIRPWVDMLQGTQLPEGTKLPLDIGEWFAPEDTTQQQSRMQTSVSSVSPKTLGFLDHLFTSPVPSPDDRHHPSDTDATPGVGTSTTNKPVSVKKSKVAPVAQSTPVYSSPFLHAEEGIHNNLDMDIGEPVWSSIRNNRSSRHTQENIVVQPSKLNFGEEDDSQVESSKSVRKRKSRAKKEAELENQEDIPHPTKKRKRDTKETKEDETKELVQNLVKGKKRKAKVDNMQETHCKKSKPQSTEDVENTQKERTLHLSIEEHTQSKKKMKKKTTTKVTGDKKDSHQPNDFRTETCKANQDVENPGGTASIEKGNEWMVNTSKTFADLLKCCQMIGEKVQEEAAEAKLQKLSLKIKRCAKMENKGKMVKFYFNHVKSKVLRLAQTVGQYEQTAIERSGKDVRNLKATDFKDNTGVMKKGQDTIKESPKCTTIVLSPENARMSTVVPSKPIQVIPELPSDKKQDDIVKKKKKRAGKGSVRKEKKLFVKNDALLKKTFSLKDTDEIDDIFSGLD
uniref:Nucleolus and neural progenitor protein-like N-terminal domain-containing protein n=1 Tax=Branchiostoma floridae TaxID=7739 RepID=C3XS37_BRAFL|eukprot:XP_002613496.1 hypothetical protein BRAFLDRAFT_119836 [Branchiostoma floridae]